LLADAKGPKPDLPWPGAAAIERGLKAIRRADAQGHRRTVQGQSPGLPGSQRIFRHLP
jgi:hypothetical protein